MWVRNGVVGAGGWREVRTSAPSGAPATTAMLHAGLLTAAMGRPGRTSDHSAVTVCGPAACRAMLSKTKQFASAPRGGASGSCSTCKHTLALMQATRLRARSKQKSSFGRHTKPFLLFCPGARIVSDRPRCASSQGSAPPSSVATSTRSGRLSPARTGSRGTLASDTATCSTALLGCRRTAAVPSSSACACHRVSAGGCRRGNSFACTTYPTRTGRHSRARWSSRHVA